MRLRLRYPIALAALYACVLACRGGDGLPLLVEGRAGAVPALARKVVRDAHAGTGQGLLPDLNPSCDSERGWLLAEGPSLARNDGRRPVTLSFDDGPSPEYTPRILQLLAQYKVHATFFLIGKYLVGDDARAEESRQIARRIVMEGHQIGNHGYEHRDLTSLSPAQAVEQVDLSQRAIHAVTGIDTELFRPPYGKLSNSAQSWLSARNKELVLWNVEVRDWERDDVDGMLGEAERRLQNARGGVVLLHDWRPSTITLLARLLARLRADRFDPARPDRAGYEMVDLPTYMQWTSRYPQPFHNREELRAGRALALRSPSTATTAMPLSPIAARRVTSQRH